MTKINQHWRFGNKAGLDFTNANSTTPPMPTLAANSSMNTGEGCASISDSNGNLLFYTDGITLWDMNNVIRVPAGPLLLGDSSSTQSAIIVPDPGNSNQYYVLTMDGSSNPNSPFNHFNGLRIDVTTWAVTPLSSLITLPSTVGFSPAEKLTAIQHKNCKDFWVVTVVQQGTDLLNNGVVNGLGSFRVFKIDASGISYVGATPMGNVMIEELGYLRGSPDGKTLAIANGRNNNVLVFPFDNSTGVINIGALSTITVPNLPPNINRNVYGVEFSPNSSILYYGTLTQGAPAYIFQVDLSLTVLTSTLVGSFANAGGGYAIGALQLGMDDRIYIAKAGEPSLGAILNPNVLGVGCNVNPNYIALPTGTVCVLGLPNLLPNPCDDDCDCGCNGCNDNADAQEQALANRAKGKFKVIVGSGNVAGCSPAPYSTMPCKPALAVQGFNLCFYLQWGDSLLDQIETHDTETLFLTVCNPYSDMRFEGLQITSVTITPGPPPLSEFQIIPDSFICFDCLEPCSCKSRELACITRDVAAGVYTVHVEYCVDKICVATHLNGSTSFPINVIQD
jgi:hypothetical protein